jgi:hypothetical protein
MNQFFKFGGLAGAGALIMFATPASAGGHFAGGHMGGAHFAAPVRPGVAVRPGLTFRHGIVAGVRAHGPGVNLGLRAAYHMGYHPGFYGRRRGFYGPVPGLAGIYGRFGYDYGYAYPRSRYATGFLGGGLPAGDYSYYSAPAYAAPAAAEIADYPVYPLGYDGASDTPTGNGVTYNVPPYLCCAPKIMYISGGHVRRETFFRPRQTIIVRGAASVD